MQHFAITIGRSLGSGGRYIGKRLAETLGAQYFDKEILALAAKESGLCEAVFEHKDEHKGFLRSVLGGVPGAWHIGDFTPKELSEETLFRIQSDAILKAAGKSDCVFIGRCADYVLRQHPRLVSIFITADSADRIHNICQRTGINEKSACKLIEQGDRERASFYNFYSDRHWGVASTYDLSVNSSRLGLDETLALVTEFVRKRLEIIHASPTL